ncbi:MAG: Rieske (2Fe-2S) protein [Bacteroidota bacterium]|nr:Rieske (2Fe-2S) protein [Bacteroidota bacterium]
MSEKSSDKNISRKKFMVRLSLSLAGLSAAVAAVPVVSALVAPLLEKVKQTWRTVGTLNDFPLSSTKLVTFENADPKSYAGVTAKSAAWLRRNDKDEFIAFAANCTHLGCPVRWEENSQLFMCPCHGGVYYKDGTVAAGPPPKPLTRYEVRVNNGDVQIKTSPLHITNMSA